MIFGETNFKYAKIILENLLVTWIFFSKNWKKLKELDERSFIIFVKKAEGRWISLNGLTLIIRQIFQEVSK